MPNRAPELEWSDSESSAPVALSRERIVLAAVEIADSEGFEAVSIRRVASRLRMRPMSLYTHIASKDDLVALMLDEVSGELLVPGPMPPGWRDAMRQIARRAYAAYTAHPWMLRVFGLGTRMGPNHMRRAEQSAQAVSSLNAPPERAWMALRVIHEWTIGHALHVVTLRGEEQIQEQLQNADDDRYPEMSKVFRHGRDEPQGDAFEIPLEAVLDGIEARFSDG